MLYRYLVLSGLLAVGLNGRYVHQEVAGPAPRAVKLVKVWETDTLLRTPESVLYYPKANVLFVANINGKGDAADGNGFISKLSPEGKITELEWAKGLNAPKGMGFFKDRLYVTDLNRVVAVNLADGQIAKTWQAEDPGAYLNDVTVDEKGVVYVSDNRNDKIFRLRNDKLEVFMEGEHLNKPNGLLVQKGKLMIGSTKTNALRSVDLVTKEITDVAGDMGATDGIVTDNKGNYLVSDWNGQIFWVGKKGGKTKLLDTKADKINSADIEYIPAKKLLLVPTFLTNRVVAYRVEE